MAGLVQCSERQIRSNIAALANLGVIEVFHRPGDGAGRKSNAYQLRLEVKDVSAASGSRLPVALDAAAEATGSVAPPEPTWPEATGSVAPEKRGGQPEVQRRATGSVAQGNRKCSAPENSAFGGGQPEVWGGQPEVRLPPNVSKERQEERKDSLCAARTLGAVLQRSALQEPEGFARFWAAWPDGQRKRGRKMALAAWVQLRLEDQAAAIVADVERRQVLDDFWLRGFTPMPQTYLRGARWEDELTQAPPQRSDSPTMRGILALEDLKWAPPLRPGLPA